MNQWVAAACKLDRWQPARPNPRLQGLRVLVGPDLDEPFKREDIV